MLVFINFMGVISNFIVFEGGDGSGTSTQLSLLEQRMKKIQKPVFFPTYEPTDGEIGVIIRSALKKDLVLQPQTIAMLFAADRNEHLYGTGGIMERTKRGELVASDRYTMSSLVYQGLECGDKLPRLLNSSFDVPEVLLFFDIDPEIAINRLKKRSSQDIYEYLDFQIKVREKYHSLLEMYADAGSHIKIIDASKNEDEISSEVWSIISQMPIFSMK